MVRKLLCITAIAALSIVASIAALAADVNVVADITTSQTWTADNVYYLGTVIHVRDGATLTIEPGTVVRGLPDSATPGTNDPGTLVIARGSKLRALGNEVNPVVFTNEEDDNVGVNPGTFPYDSLENALGTTGTWGGVIVLGRGYVANNTASGPNASREVQIEGLTAAGGLGLYGNCAGSALALTDCDDDDSGTLSYVSIRYGGFNLSANNEINGLTLGAVGRETELSHIEVFQNKDDGIELFGGAANLKYVMAVNGGDDAIDYDEGWRGKAQFVFAMQGTPGADKSDKGGEHDGGNGPDGSQPKAIPTIYNATYIGLGQKGFTAAKTNSALLFRDNAGGRYYNSFFGDFGGTSVLIEGGSSAPTSAATSGERSIAAYTPGTGNCSVTTGTACDDAADCPGGESCVLHYGDPDSAFELELEDNTFWCIKRHELLAGPSYPPGGDRAPGVLVTQGVCSASGTPCLAAANCPGGETCDDSGTEWGGDAGKVHHDNAMFTNAALGNQYVDCAGSSPIRTLTRLVIADGTVPDPVGSIDPRPEAGSPLLTTDRVPPADGFFEPASFRGAFGATNWATGWSNLGRLGYFTTCSPGGNAIPGEVPAGPVFANDKVTLTWQAPVPPGGSGAQSYDVLVVGGSSSSAAASFAQATCLEAGDTDTTAQATDAPAAGEVFFYVVRAVNDCGLGSIGFQSSGIERPAGSCP